MIKNASVKAQDGECFKSKRDRASEIETFLEKKRKKENVRALWKGKMSSSPGKYRKI